MVALPARALAQDSATVVLGADYARSHGFLGLGGQGWRSAWAVPVTLPVLTPAVLGGGLEDVRPGPDSLPGVFTGRGASDGLARRVLPVDPDPIAPALPADARRTQLPEFLRDLASTLHPGAPALAAALYREAGLAAVPRVLGAVGADGLADVPGIEAPGEAAWVERAPEFDDRPALGFERVVATDSLLALQRAEPGTGIDLRAYLAARLVDVILGDRQRAESGWLWGWDAARGLWVPVARGQQQALLRAGRGSRLLLGAYRPGFVSFEAEAPKTRAVTLRAWDLDRPWLARLDRATWDSVASALAARLDDAAIDRAVAALPDEHRRIGGEEIARALRVRRDALPRIVDEYYRLMVQYPDLQLGDAADSIRAVRSADGSLALFVRHDGRDALLRRFVPSETEEVRLHLGGGDDLLRLEGMEHAGIGLRVTGGPGLDRVERLGPSTNRVVLYDDENGIVREPGDAARLVPHEIGRQVRWVDHLPPPPADFGHVKSPAFLLGYNGDLGVYAGTGMQWKWYGFGEPFYRQRARVTVAYATKPSSFRGTAFFERRNVLRNVHLSVDGLASGIEVVRYQGLGNETVDTADAEFYRARHEEYTLRLMAGFSGDPALELRVGPVVSLLSTDTTSRTSLVAIENPYGAGQFHMAGLEAMLRYRPDRSSFAPGFGVAATAFGKYYPAVLDVEDAFGGVGGEVDLTYVPRFAGRSMLAARVGGSVLTGRVPFSAAARVGGPQTLRGYAVNRFTGDRGSAYASLELRSRLTRFRFGNAPGDLGLLAFGSGGRVWQRNESSDVIHWAWGGGVWIAPTLNWLPGLDDLVGRFELAKSAEGLFYYFGTGFRF